MGTLQFCAGTYASGAQNAPIVINDVSRMAHIDMKTRIVVRIPNVCDFKRLRKRLEFTATVRYAHRADVVAFD
ncbi:MAG: hypothetical protein WCA10_13355 [Terracidiphilus sp.]